ncbi:hypothetical protein OHV13_01165 [Kitasatospora purpeofusca]|uniref:hypothetical protein n=1 Tax=Kitasatospora purpeofusca TaxID=67352 RepID=UPI00324DEF22
MRLTSSEDGLATLALEDGRKVNYGRNPDGTLVPEYGGSDVGQWIDPNHLRIDGTDYYLDRGQVTRTEGFGNLIKEYNATTGIGVLNLASSDRKLYLQMYGGKVSWVSTDARPQDPNALTWQYEYDGDYLARVCGPAKNCTTYTYEASRLDGAPRRLVKVQRARAENSTAIAYNGNLVEHVGKSDNTATGVDNGWTYDRRTDTSGPRPNLIVHRTDPRGVHTYYQYNPMGQLEYRWYGTPTPPPGRTRMFLYDVVGHLTASVDENGNVQRYSWYSGTNQLGSTIRYRTPVQPVITERAEYYSSSWAGDWRNGRPLSVTDANQHTTTTGYNWAGSVTTSTDPTGGVTRTDWACQDVLSPPAVNDSHPAHTGPASTCNVPVTVTDPGGRTTTFGYDGHGDQTKVTTPDGQSANTFHDDLGRVVKRSTTDAAHPEGVATTYTYDKAGRLATETGAPVTNPVTGVTHQARTTYTYDKDGNPATSTVADLTPAAQGGDAPRTTTYGYDAQDRLTTVTQDGVTTKRVTYDQLGNVTDSWSPNGAHYVYGYDLNGRLNGVDLLDVEGEHVRLPADRVAELVGLSLGDLTVKWWFTPDSDLVCGIAYSGYGWEKHTYFLDALTVREADTVTEVLLGEVRARPEETTALVVDRTGRTAEFDWDPVVGGASTAVPLVPEALLLAEPIADALTGLPATAARSAFAPGLTLVSGR